MNHKKENYADEKMVQTQKEQISKHLSLSDKIFNHLVDLDPEDYLALCRTGY